MPRLWTRRRTSRGCLLCCQPPPAEVTKPSESGGAHGMGTRTVYFNEAGAMANKDATMTMYPVGTMIVKEIMDDTNMFVPEDREDDKNR